jgi:hypothetical protein
MFPNGEIYTSPAKDRSRMAGGGDRWCLLSFDPLKKVKDTLFLRERWFYFVLPSEWDE